MEQEEEEKSFRINLVQISNCIEHWTVKTKEKRNSFSVVNVNAWSFLNFVWEQLNTIQKSWEFRNTKKWVILCFRASSDRDRHTIVFNFLPSFLTFHARRKKIRKIQLTIPSLLRKKYYILVHTPTHKTERAWLLLLLTTTNNYYYINHKDKKAIAQIIPARQYISDFLGAKNQ